MVEEFQTLLDLWNDVLGDEPAAGIEVEAAQVAEQFRGRGALQRGQGERRGFAFEMQLHGAADAVEAFAMAGGTGLALVGDVLGRIDAEFAQARERIILVVLRLEHPWENAAMAAAGRTPAAG
jgi:hypothetical protein